VSPYWVPGAPRPGPRVPFCPKAGWLLLVAWVCEPAVAWLVLLDVTAAGVELSVCGGGDVWAVAVLCWLTVAG
jgi:hypothetical protein